ncbi:MAG: hypothetical protein KQJ78_09860 [Deltaproteobacteria bacterium]|nr:hypothetical protein [Deltaproteobacteria bacterium]
MDWWPLTEVTLDGEGGVRARAWATADSPWFDGHFPNQAVLPGVALLAWGRELLAFLTREAGQTAALSGLHRVKFKKMIEPDQELELTLKPGNKPGWFLLEITREGEAVASGHLLTNLA